MRKFTVDKQQQMEDRCIRIGRYVVENRCTVRAASEQFEVSKSTVHKDLTERLKHVDKSLYDQVMEIFRDHIETRHLNGGEATRRKYESIRNNQDGNVIRREYYSKII